MVTDAQQEYRLLAMGTECSDPEQPGQGVAPVAAELVTCEVCGKKDIELPMMRHHIGAHLLQPNWEMYSKLKPQEPCGWCGVRTSYGQTLMDPTVLPGSCPVSREKNNAAWRAVHQCKLVGKGPKYSLGAAGNSTVGAPCTNRPMACPVPGCALVVWSYNLEAHYVTAHLGAEFTAELQKEVRLGVHEASWMQHLLAKKAVPPSLACKTADCPCKVNKKRK